MGIVIDATSRFNERRKIAEYERQLAHRESPETQDRFQMLMNKLKKSFDEHPGDPT
jgi:hypothetical protein